jgi:putative FmdB family regulatory protein
MIYKYFCNVCNIDFEIDHKKQTLLICPQCKGEDIRKLFYIPNMVYKGNGFYNTDYKNKKDKNGN